MLKPHFKICRFHKKAFLFLATVSVLSLNASIEQHNIAEIHVEVIHMPIIVQNYYYALPGKSEEVYRCRRHASEIRTKLDLRQGRILRRIIDEKIHSVDLPDVVWECEYPSKEARIEDQKRLADSSEFAEIERYMETLIQKFQRLVFEVAN